MNIPSFKFKKILYLLIPLVLVALTIIRLKSNKEAAGKKVYRFDHEKALYIQTDTLQTEEVSPGLSFSGLFEPEKETRIASEIQGKIIEMRADLGTRVRKGQILVLLDQSLLKLQIQSAEVQIEGLEADVERYRILAGADAIQGVQLEKALLALRSARLQKALLLEQLNKTSIQAPFDGIVTAKLSELGAFASPGLPLLQISDLSSLKFTIQIPETDLKRLSAAKQFEVVPDVYPGLVLPAKAVVTGSKSNAGNSFPVQFSVRNTADMLIRSGMFGKVYVKQKDASVGMLIPASAITGTEERPLVYRVKNGRVFLHPVVLSERIQNKALLVSGLNPGDVIAVNGLINLSDSARVMVK